MNLTNKHSRKYEGFANDQVRPPFPLPNPPNLPSNPASNTTQAIGIQADSPNTIGLTTKLGNRWNKPASSFQRTSFGANTPSRKVYKSVVNSTAKKGYRADLREEAVARASAVKASQQDKKDSKRVSKPRGAKARKAAETS